ncbi:MAG: radical SAM protein [Pseudomonadota bacterium]
MKVLLINPAWGRSGLGIRRYQRAWPPLDLLTAAALLRRHGHEPSLVDLRAARISPAELQAQAAEADLILLQTTPIDRWQCPDLNWEALLGLALRLPEEKTVIAGAHGTLRPDLILKTTGALALIRGQPEGPLLSLVRAGLDPRGLSGFSYMDKSRPVHEPDQRPIPLDALPPPAYDLVDLDRYGYELLGPRLALLETSRGCPFSCSFCLKAMYGPDVTFKTTTQVVEEVRSVVGRGARSIYFIDLEFSLRRPETMVLCHEMMKLGLSFKWCCQTRVDAVDPELLTAMRKAGCRLIHFGLETGAEHLLEAVNKKASLQQARQAIEWCRRLEIQTACFFLFGLPGENRADRRRTMALARELTPTYASFHAAAPYPGTALNSLARGNEAYPACLAEHDLDELASEIRRAYLSFYLRPSYILSRLKEEKLKDLWPKLLLLYKLAL